MRFMLWLSLMVTLGLNTECGHVTPDLQMRNGGTATNETDLGGTDELADIRTSLQQLSTGEHSEIEMARKTLLDIARKSEKGRTQVIKALMSNMNKPNLNLERDRSDYYLWREGADLLGELKATEALDLLISHLHLTDGFHSSSMVHQPAILGVRRMGSIAIPKLETVLQQSSNRDTRMAAAFCLTEIGGASALTALKRALDVESNQCVIRFINVSLRVFSYQTKSGLVSFDNEAPQADINARREFFMAYQCID